MMMNPRYQIGRLSRQPSPSSLQISAVRQATVLEEYNKELYCFTAVKEHDLASVSPQLLIKEG